MINRLPVLLAILALGTGCASAEPQVGLRVPLKLGDPKEAALTYVRAIGRGDAPTARAACLGTEAQKRWTTITATFVDGLLSFDQAAMNRFGPAASASHMETINALNGLTVEPENAVQNANVRIDGQTADLKAASRIYGKHMRHAQFAKSVNGVWKIDLPRLFQEHPDIAAENESPDLDRILKIGQAMKRVAGEIAQQKFKTLEEAQRAVDERTQ